MCAISGIFSKNINDKQIDLLKKINNILTHRGPDSTGLYNDSDVVLGHNRLAILDLSKNGHQPMISKTGRYILTFNGEIYNHIQIRKNFFDNFNWRGTSDTETLVELIEKKGINESLKIIDGMYAFGLWDRKERKLIITRDKFGEKPLYYAFHNNRFIFASELKAFEIFKNHLDINIDSVKNYLNLSYIPSPHTIYKNINKLSPACILTINHNIFENKNFNGFTQLDETNAFKIEKYWSGFEENEYIDNTKSFSDFKSKIKYELEKSVEEKMISDVPIGVFLSGGIDSTLIASIMKNLSSKKINTFTISSNNINFDESERAAEIAKYFNFNHHSLEVSKNDQLDIIDELNNTYDEPFSDSSQIPSIILSKYTKKYVKVALTGDGADEIFYGYNRYFFSKLIWNKTKHLPDFTKKFLSEIIYKINPSRWIKFQSILNKSIFKSGNIELLDEKMYKIGDALKNSESILDNYMSYLMIWQNNECLTSLESKNSLKRDLFSKISIKEDNFENIINLLDIKSYLPDDILVKTDRASMKFGLETRAPYLSNKLLNISMHMPLNYRTDKKKGKLILRDILNDYLPKKYTHGPKKGFSIPMSDWLNNSLKVWAEDLFNSQSYLKNNILNNVLINNYWADHKAKKRNYHKRLWNILILIDWLNKKGFTI